MGRYAQAHRRSSHTAAPPAVVPPPSLVTALDDGGGTINLTFDGPVTADPGGVPDALGLVLDTNPTTVTSAANLAPNVIQINQTLDPSAGTTAAWAQQPTWIVEPVNTSSSAPVT
jgi:hypothetical protein